MSKQLNMDVETVTLPQTLWKYEVQIAIYRTSSTNKKKEKNYKLETSPNKLGISVTSSSLYKACFKHPFFDKN